MPLLMMESNMGGKMIMRIDLSNENLMLHETLYFTGNGYIGIRANFEEGYPSDYDSIRGPISMVTMNPTQSLTVKAQ